MEVPPARIEVAIRKIQALNVTERSATFAALLHPDPIHVAWIEADKALSVSLDGDYWTTGPADYGRSDLRGRV